MATFIAPLRLRSISTTASGGRGLALGCTCTADVAARRLIGRYQRRFLARFSRSSQTCHTCTGGDPFDGSLYFANVAYFEDAVLEAVANHPDARYVLVVGDGINQLDASGEEVVHHLVERLRSTGITLVFSGLKRQVLDVMRATSLYDVIGQNNLFATEDQAIAAIYEQLGENASDDLFCLVPTAR